MKYEIKLSDIANHTLNSLTEKDFQNYRFLVNGIQELSLGISSNSVKNIGKENGITVYRKRMGRWRILFTVSSITITIWIIDIEKDTRKDYDKRKKYINSKLKY